MSLINPEILLSTLSGLDQISDPIKAGGQKIVYQCRQDDVSYALKVLKLPPATTDEEAADREAVLARVQREIDVMHSIQNPHLVKPGPIGLETIDVEGEEFACFTEEWIEGEDISSRIQSTSLLTEMECWQLTRQVSTVIEELWQKKLLHRDISAGNIMIRSSGDFVLVDLGYAFDFLSPSLTKLHGIPGTLQYMAPERFNFANKRNIDFRADLFSLGIVLYMGISNQHPYYEKHMSGDDYVHHVCNGTDSPERVGNLVSGLSEQLDTLIMRLISRQPHLRFRNCRLVHEAATNGIRNLNG